MAVSTQTTCLEVTREQLASWLPIPNSQAHKYSRGKAVLVGGSAPYPGAACMAALASQYVGAGYTEVFTAQNNVPILQTFRPSLVVRPFSALKADQVLSSHYPGACIFGPGADASDEELKACLAQVIRDVQKPLLIDGGALGFTATQEIHDLLIERGDRGLVTVLTPHGGEAARLADCAGVVKPGADCTAVAESGSESATKAGAATNTVNSNVVSGGAKSGVEPVATTAVGSIAEQSNAAAGSAAKQSNASAQAAYASALSKAYKAVVILKGPETYIASGDTVYEFNQGTPALAKAGTGDVLAGIIGGLLAQGLDIMQASILGVNLHAMAAHQAIESYSLISVCAEEVLQSLPGVLARLEMER